MPSEASLANLRPPWPKGQSAYAFGAKGYRSVLAMARKASPESMQTMIDCMRDKNAAWRERIFAAAAIIERGYGKPKETISVNGDGIHTLRIEIVDPLGHVDAVTISANERSDAPTIDGTTNLEFDTSEHDT